MDDVPLPVSPVAGPRTVVGRVELLQKAALVTLGLTLACAGAIAVFTSPNDVGSTALLLGGIAVVLAAFFADRLQSLRYGDLEITLLQKAQEYERHGNVAAAQMLRDAAATLAGRMATASADYRRIRTSMAAGEERTRLMDSVLEQGRQAASDSAIPAEEVLARLWTGSPGARIWALGFLQERPASATVRVVLDAVRHPDEMYDQFHALELARKFLDTVREIWTCERISETVEHHRPRLGQDRECLTLADIVMRRAEERATEIREARAARPAG